MVKGFADAIALRADGDVTRGDVARGWDVFGIPHGGYLMAQAGNAALHAVDLPDLLSITTHFLRKAAFGPIEFSSRIVGASRRFTTVAVDARQDDELVHTSLVLMGDRDAFDGPRWTNREAPVLGDDDLVPEAGSPGWEGVPAVAHRMRLRLAKEDAHVFESKPNGSGVVRAVGWPSEGERTDQLLALLAADVTPPAMFNAIGVTGWVPTVELSAQLRARPADGPLTIVVRTTDIGEGFLDEEAEVYDSTGRLIVHSNQHARHAQPA